MRIIDPDKMNQTGNQPGTFFAHRFQVWLYRIEDALLVSLLLVMILLAACQIFLRNILDGGLVWADALVRILVLWIGLVGAMAASRKGDHIKIDLISKYLKTHYSWMIKSLTDCFTAVVCSIVLFYSIKLVRFEYIDAHIAFGIIPVWICQAIIPFAFLVMALRYGIGAVSNLIVYFHQKP